MQMAIVPAPSTCLRYWPQASMTALAVMMITFVPPSTAVAGRPFELAQGKRPQLLDQPFETPHQLLRLLDIGPSDFRALVDGEPIGAADEETFLKSLLRMPQIGRELIGGWLHDPINWDQLANAPATQRGEFFLLRGRAVGTKRRSVQQPLADLFDLGHYYEIEVAIPRVGRITVYSRNVPHRWRDARRLDERCEVRAMFLKLGAPRDGQPHFLFVTQRVAWLPDRVNPSLGVGPDQVLLGELGMDLALFDPVRKRNGQSISAAERDAFYALLRATRKATPQMIARRARAAQLEKVLQRPEQLHGNVLRVAGSVQRITRVMVREPDIRERFGIDHYYQLDLLVPLGETEVRVRSTGTDNQQPVYRGNFPFTCCALSIPASWQRRLGEQRTNLPATVEGFFFKLWAYPNAYVTSLDATQRQLSPMLIVRPPPRHQAASGGNEGISFAIGTGFLALLAGIWCIIWWLNRSDHHHAQTVLRRRFKSAEPPELPRFEAGAPSHETNDTHPRNQHH